MSKPIRVVVVDDSPFVCRLLTAHLQSAADVRVVGVAHDGEAALRLVKELRPGVVTLDLGLRGMSGLDVLEAIVREAPTPVLVVSGVSRGAREATVRALQRGAVDYVLKYTPNANTDPEALRQELLSKVRRAAGIKVIRSLDRRLQLADCSLESQSARCSLQSAIPKRVRHAPATEVGELAGVVVIGASTGGPVALLEVLAALPVDFPVAVLIVQHMPAKFTRVLAAQLDRHVPMTVREAESGEPLRPGVALVAPGDYHLIATPHGHVHLDQGPKEGGHRPSADVTLRSVAEVFGGRTIGVLLTGMGSDGADGMAAVHAAGGRTIAQDADSCVVNGMPQQAIDRGAVDHVAPPAEIGVLLRMLAGRLTEGVAV